MATDAGPGVGSVEVAGIAVDSELHVACTVSKFGIWMGCGIMLELFGLC
jgi:hypothetical protein